MRCRLGCCTPYLASTIERWRLALGMAAGRQGSDGATQAYTLMGPLLPAYVHHRRMLGLCSSTTSVDFSAGFVLRSILHRLIQRWKPRAESSPVYYVQGNSIRHGTYQCHGMPLQSSLPCDLGSHAACHAMSFTCIRYSHSRFLWVRYFPPQSATIYHHPACRAREGRCHTTWLHTTSHPSSTAAAMLLMAAAGHDATSPLCTKRSKICHATWHQLPIVNSNHAHSLTQPLSHSPLLSAQLRSPSGPARPTGPPGPPA